jgi:large subunit ribosomal protein L13
MPMRNLHKIDATGISVGRLASKIAILLRGKNKASFVPNQDEGDIVEISNVAAMKVTGKKLEQKIYYHHSNYPGGLRETQMKKLMGKDPFEVLRKAVWNMLPKNKLRAEMIKRLRVSK